MALGNLFRRKPCEAQARALYRAVVAQARRPEFYTHCGVPDTLDGRFDLLAVHAFLLLHRLKRDRPASAELAQAVFDVMFEDLDQNLRELGAGDLGLGRKVKGMAQALYGRIAAYEAALEGPEADLEAALRRNLYRHVAPAPGCVRALAAYMRRQAAALEGQSYAGLAAGGLSFGAPPAGTQA